MGLGEIWKGVRRDRLISELHALVRVRSLGSTSPWAQDGAPLGGRIQPTGAGARLYLYKRENQLSPANSVEPALWSYDTPIKHESSSNHRMHYAPVAKSGHS